MNQVLQNLKTGVTDLAEVPTPFCRPGHLLIATRRSLISAGTERMLVEFGQANLLAKARSQPEKVRQALDKLRTDGFLPTMNAVFSRLDQPLPLGYCNAGAVLEVGEDVSGFAVGDRVASNGCHAEIVCVPKHLCARVPDGVSDDSAAFTVLGSVALQGIRLAAPTLGESVAVIGLGLVGLMAVQMLRANGCRVIGIDLNPRRLALARQFGAATVDLSIGADPVAAGMAFSQGRGLDAVLIAASTASSDPVHQAAQMSRQRGRIVLVGVTGLELSRADFYEKELTFQVSCSYGPGRYDPAYEQQGHDYPISHVRWTEQRNLEAVLHLMAEGRLDVAPLVSHRVPLSQAARAYDLLTEDRSSLGIVLAYPDAPALGQRTIAVAPALPTTSEGQAVVAMIGAGNFARFVLLPALSKTPARLRTIASGTGMTASQAAKKFGFEQATSDYRTTLDDPLVNTVFIATRHHTHAHMVVEALQAGKHVFVEKPLALNREELAAVRDAYIDANGQQLMVGYNRRFAPLAIKLKQHLEGRTEPINLIYTINAGNIPPDHWTQDHAVGGGRIIGEGCHFVDLLRHLVGLPIVAVQSQVLGEHPSLAIRQDKMTILLKFADGSSGTVHYLANGNKRYPKERLEVFSQGRVAVLDNWKTLRGYGWPGLATKRLWRQDKGHRSEVAAFVQRVAEGGPPLIAWDELEEVSLVTFDAVARASERMQPIDRLTAAGDPRDDRDTGRT